MSVWLWLAIAAVSLLALSLLVGLVVARILGSIGRSVSELLETEAWAAAPLTHSREDEAVVEPKEVSESRPKIVRLR